MNDVVETLRVSQAQILQVQDALLAGDDCVEPTTEHYFADGVYGRLMKVPAGNWVIGKAHKTKHISILLKGKASITMDDGTVKYLEAPMMTVVPAGKKKMAYVLEEMWFVNIHPTDTEDLDIIESRVIVPENEFRAELFNGDDGGRNTAIGDRPWAKDSYPGMARAMTQETIDKRQATRLKNTGGKYVVRTPDEQAAFVESCHRGWATRRANG